MARVDREKSRNVRVKYHTYERQVWKYHQHFTRARKLPLPDLVTVMKMTTEDPFWNRGEVEVGDQHEVQRERVGIQSFLTRRSAHEELRRIAREVRQMMGWAVNYHSRLSKLKNRVVIGEHNYHESILLCEADTFHTQHCSS